MQRSKVTIMSQNTANPLIVALDLANKEKALDICRSLGHNVEIFKVGLQLFLAAGSRAVESINSMGYKVFLDLKLCDIPFQASEAAGQIVKMKVKMFTVHTMGGLEMMKKVVQRTGEVSRETGIEKPLILGVTVLTSLDRSQIEELGIKREVEDQAAYLAQLAQEAGLDGVVASGQETRFLRQALGEDFIIVTPGIRPSGTVKGDQARTLTPGEAVRAGADYIVVGRPIVCSPNPVEAALKILEEINK